jgi:ABC-2 type transport system permease protein
MISIGTISNGAFGIYFPKFIGTIYEVLSAPISFLEIVIGYVGAAATKSLLIGIIILITSFFFVKIEIAHPFAMVAFLVLTCISFALLGFIIGIWAENWEQLQLVPLLVITPLIFLGGSFYSISMLPSVWQIISMFNPVFYLISGFRWAFSSARCLMRDPIREDCTGLPPGEFISRATATGLPRVNAFSMVGARA